MSYAATLTVGDVVCRHPDGRRCRMPPPWRAAMSYAATLTVG